ncbi:MAG: metalloregulator ArsR/SmtB family transcription factor [Acidimicrobiales bacterium]
MADPSRRRVLDLVVERGEASASWLAGQVPFTRQAVSKHLAVLEEAGLVARRKQGREVLYRVDAARLDQATRALAEVAERWDRRLAAIKRLAEAAHAATQAQGDTARADTTTPIGADHANPNDRVAPGMGRSPSAPPGEGEGADEGP